MGYYCFHLHSSYLLVVTHRSFSGSRSWMCLTCMALQAVQNATIKCHFGDDSVPGSAAATLWECLEMVLQSPGRHLNLSCEQELPQPPNTGYGKCSFVREGTRSQGWSTIAAGCETMAREKDKCAGVAQITPVPWLALLPSGRLGCPDHVHTVRCCSFLPNQADFPVQLLRSQPWTVPDPKLPPSNVWEKTRSDLSWGAC